MKGWRDLTTAEMARVEGGQTSTSASASITTPLEQCQAQVAQLQQQLQLVFLLLIFSAGGASFQGTIEVD